MRQLRLELAALIRLPPRGARRAGAIACSHVSTDAAGTLERGALVFEVAMGDE